MPEDVETDTFCDFTSPTTGIDETSRASPRTTCTCTRTSSSTRTPTRRCGRSATTRACWPAAPASIPTPSAAWTTPLNSSTPPRRSARRSDRTPPRSGTCSRPRRQRQSAADHGVHRRVEERGPYIVSSEFSVDFAGADRRRADPVRRAAPALLRPIRHAVGQRRAAVPVRPRPGRRRPGRGGALHRVVLGRDLTCEVVVADAEGSATARRDTAMTEPSVGRSAISSRRTERSSTIGGRSAPCTSPSVTWCGSGTSRSSCTSPIPRRPTPCNHGAEPPSRSATLRTGALRRTGDARRGSHR